MNILINFVRIRIIHFNLTSILSLSVEFNVDSGYRGSNGYIICRESPAN